MSTYQIALGEEHATLPVESQMNSKKVEYLDGKEIATLELHTAGKEIRIKSTDCFVAFVYEF